MIFSRLLSRKKPDFHDLEKTHLGWCEHGWTWWPFHFLALFLGSVGYSFLFSKQVSGFFQINLLTIVFLGVGVYLLRYCYTFSLWLFFSFIAFISAQSSAPLALLGFCSYLYFIVYSRSGSFENRLKFSISPIAFSIYRLVVGGTWALVLLSLPCASVAIFTLMGISFACLIMLCSVVSLFFKRSSHHFERFIVAISLFFFLFEVLERRADISMLHFISIASVWNWRLMPARRLEHPVKEAIIYDDSCGFCTKCIKVVLLEDQRTTPFFFTPRSTILTDSINQEQKAAGSIAVINDEKKVLQAEKAIIYILLSLGGFWAILGRFVNKLPKKFTSRMYQTVASWRYRLPVSKVCEPMPEIVRHRFKNQSLI